MIFTGILPLRRRFIQYEENVFSFFFWKVFHTVLKKIKAVILSGTTVFFINKPDMALFPEWIQQFAKPESQKFFKMKTRAVTGARRTASKDETMSCASHREKQTAILGNTVVSEDELCTQSGTENYRPGF